MSEYRIAAIPTVYRGRRFRSRLEAKWAAFFDLLGWDYEYEPFDLGKWSPDFLLKGCGGSDVLVEVKPLSEFDAAVAAKMVAGRADARSNCALLLVGAAPIPHFETTQLGWAEAASVLNEPALQAAILAGNSPVSWRPAAVLWERQARSVGWVPDIGVAIISADRTEVIGSQRLLTGGCSEGLPTEGPSYGEFPMRLWAEASNEAQWNGERQQ